MPGSPTPSFGRDTAPNAHPGFVRRLLVALARAQGPVRWRRENPVICLVGTILSQATNDRLAERAWRALRARYPAWKHVLSAPHAGIERAIRMCGLARQKARAIRAVLRHLRRTRGRFSLAAPRRPVRDPVRRTEALLAELTGIPGIGIKTAAITLMFGFGADLCAVDTHVARILRRLRVVPAKAAPDRAYRILRPLVPPGRGIELHLRLLRLGRETCRALRPRCGSCPIQALCSGPGMRGAAP